MTYVARKVGGKISFFQIVKNESEVPITRAIAIKNGYDASYDSVDFQEYNFGGVIAGQVNNISI